MTHEYYQLPGNRGPTYRLSYGEHKYMKGIFTATISMNYGFDREWRPATLPDGTYVQNMTANDQSALEDVVETQRQQLRGAGMARLCTRTY